MYSVNNMEQEQPSNKNGAFENLNKILLGLCLVILILVSVGYLVFQYDINKKTFKEEMVPATERISAEEQEEVLINLAGTSISSIKDEDKAAILDGLSSESVVANKDRFLLIETLK